MAACINNPTNHCIYITSDSPCCQITDSLTNFIKLCHPIYQYPFHTNKKFKESPKISPQECTIDQDHINPPQECTDYDHIWLKIRQEAESDIIQEPILSNFYTSSILSHTSLESALANQLSTKLHTPHLSRDTLYPVFLKTLLDDEIKNAIRADLKAVKDRDPACMSYVHCLLHFKGFLAIQAHRSAHKLWSQGRTMLALIIQSRVSEVLAVDIHPAARIGRGVVFDHGTGVVVGETAVVGNDVTVLHGVTLGGTGKVKGDRHPKIGDGVLIGAGAKVLGNVGVGENARIGAGSVVLKEVPAGATAVGSPARVVGFR